jgi:hypothetical protein
MSDSLTVQPTAKQTSPIQNWFDRGDELFVTTAFDADRRERELVRLRGLRGTYFWLMCLIAVPWLMMTIHVAVEPNGGSVAGAVAMAMCLMSQFICLISADYRIRLLKVVGRLQEQHPSEATQYG